VSRRPIRRIPAPAGRGLLTPLALAVAAVLASASACSSTSGQAPASTTASPPARTTTPAATPPPATLTLDEHAGLTSVNVHTGTSVVVRLHSTYWSTPTSSDPGVLRPDGGGSTSTGSCPPGGGCGVASARFTAAHPGTVRITAHRTSCGEAMRCPPGHNGYEVTVTVSG
jgi:hypothetical protein